MVVVADILPALIEVAGTSDQARLFGYLDSAQELLGNKADWDPRIVTADICVTNRCVALPDDCEAPLAMNVNGQPSTGRSPHYEFNMNGSGSLGSPLAWVWDNQGFSPQFQDLKRPSRLIAVPQTADDNGKRLRVWGVDSYGREVRTKDCNGNWMDGFMVPIMYGYPFPAPEAPLVARVTRVRKEDTNGYVQLVGIDTGTPNGTVIGHYRPNETEPLYRRVTISTDCAWLRLRYRKKTYRVTSVMDMIPLHSREALIMAVKAIINYRRDSLSQGAAFEDIAVRLLTEAESSRVGPQSFRINVDKELYGFNPDSDTCD